MPRRGGPGGPPASFRILVLYREGSFPEAEARRWEQGLLAQFKTGHAAEASGWPAVRLEGLVEAMFSGGVSEAGRQGAAAAPGRPRPAGMTLGQVFANRDVAGVVLKQSGGDTPCPPPDCGCSSGYYKECSCALLRNPGMPDFCMCLLCYEKHMLPDLRLAGGRTLVIVVAGRADQDESLASVAWREIPQLGPPTAGLTIKVKSSRP